MARIFILITWISEPNNYFHDFILIHSHIILIVNLLLLFIFGLTLTLYLPLNRQIPRFRFKIPLDDSIPLIPWTVWIYVSYYLLLPLSVLLLWNSGFFNEFLAVQIIGTLLASAFWKIIPNGVTRPSLTQTHNLHLRTLSLIYRHDGDSNGLPSGHVLHTFIACYFLALQFPQFWIYFFLILVLISLSTLTTKQHYFLDIAITPVVTLLIIEATKLLLNPGFISLVMYIIRS